MDPWTVDGWTVGRRDGVDAWTQWTPRTAGVDNVNLRTCGRRRSCGRFIDPVGSTDPVRVLVRDSTLASELVVGDYRMAD